MSHLPPQHVVDSALDSQSRPVPYPRPAPGAPNVVMIVLDDVGFAQLGCFGSGISTPRIDEVAEQLQTTLQVKLAVAGIHVDEARLTHLAYASEIAGAMLKRQQAVAIFQARRYMVENALAIIDEVMLHFDKSSGVAISDDKKADLINSLLVVMTSEKESSPVLNVGR